MVQPCQQKTTRTRAYIDKVVTFAWVEVKQRPIGASSTGCPFASSSSSSRIWFSPASKKPPVPAHISIRSSPLRGSKLSSVRSELPLLVALSHPLPVVHEYGSALPAKNHPYPRIYR